MTRVSYSYCTAQETLRLWPVTYIIYRQAAVDDVLPLSKPITLTNGKVVNELPIPKGQKIIASVLAYNRWRSSYFSFFVTLVQIYVLTTFTHLLFHTRNEEIFGPESDVFRPERWFSGAKKGINVDVFSNL
jgi:hypothetical protein